MTPELNIPLRKKFVIEGSPFTFVSLARCRNFGKKPNQTIEIRRQTTFCRCHCQVQEDSPSRAPSLAFLPPTASFQLILRPPGQFVSPLTA